jgi:uncharacterized protein (TIGR03086 family)
MVKTGWSQRTRPSSITFRGIVTTSPDPHIEQLSLSLAAVGELVRGVRDEQWLAPTPCTDWDVRTLVNHLVGMNLVFTAILNDQPPPERGGDRLGDEPGNAYLKSGSMLLAAFEQPGVLERTYRSPLGDATGEDRLQIRLYDLLAHGWDLAKATGQDLQLPDDVAEQSLAFVQVQLSSQSRTGRFNEAQSIRDSAPAIDRLAAFLGRSVSSP